MTSTRVPVCQWDGFSELLKTVFGLPFARLGDHVVDVLGGSWACFGGPARFAANAIMSSASLAGHTPSLQPPR